MTKNQTMMLITVPLNETHNSFRMMPFSKDCPFIDAVYWPHRKAIEVVSPFKKNDYNMFQKLDDNGEPMRRKTPGVDENGRPMLFKQERKAHEVLMNYFITKREEIEEFIKAFAVNADSFDYLQFLDAPDIEVEE